MTRLLPLSEAIDGILGRPYEWGATGPGRFYCLGVGIHLLEVTRGIQLPNPYNAPPEVFREFFARLEEIPPAEARRPLDILYWHNGADGEAHCVWVEDERWVVSIETSAGVFRQPYGEALARATKAFRVREGGGSQ